MFNLGMANGAKVGLKLRLRHYKLESIREINPRIFLLYYFGKRMSSNIDVLNFYGLLNIITYSE